MKFMGIDYGKRRVGIAVSDPQARIAFPKEILLNVALASLIKKIKEFADKEGVAKIIVGLPLAANGNDTQQTKEVRDFVLELEKEIYLPIDFENELLTSKIAESALSKKEPADASAAALILQSYLDKK